MLYKTILALVVFTSIAGAQQADQYARYTTPGQCEAAAARANGHYWRDKRPDTVAHAPLTGSLPASVILAAQNCAKRFSVSVVPERDLLDLAQLHIMANQDAQARTAIDHLLKSASKRSVVERGWTLQLWITSLLKSKPARVEMAKQYIAQLEALGDSAAAWKMFTHQEFAGFFLGINDRASALTHARLAIDASKKMARNDRIDWALEILGGYGAAAKVAAIDKGARGGAAALAIFDTAVLDVAGLRPAGWIEGIINRDVKPVYLLQGTRAPAVRGSKWYNAAGDTLKPHNGRVTLLVLVTPRCAARCYPMYATIRRLHAKYEANLDIVFMSTTSGYFRRQLMTSPTVEADSTGSYFINFLKLPAVVAVEETSFSYRATDGRRINIAPVNVKNYSRGVPGILVDKQGVIQFLSDVSPGTESTLDFLIKRAQSPN